MMMAVFMWLGIIAASALTLGLVVYVFFGLQQAQLAHRNEMKLSQAKGDKQEAQMVFEVEQIRLNTNEMILQNKHLELEAGKDEESPNGEAKKVSTAKKVAEKIPDWRS